MPLTSLAGVLTLIEALPKVVAAAPEFKRLFEEGILPLFKPHEQTQLKESYRKAREGSDAAQADFVQAGRGQ